MSDTLTAFAHWLSTTSISLVIQNISWLVPMVQSIHILAISIVMASALVVSLRVIGLLMPDVPMDKVCARHVPWLWWALGALLVSGLALLVGEPERSLTNGIFQLKMLMLTAAIACTLLLRRPVRTNPGIWDAESPLRGRGVALAVLGVALWICIVFAGRWIAYAGE